jgi:NADPH:quinone reductase-like Zn-dependent oxidoreductase
MCKTNVYQVEYTVVVTASPRDFERQKKLGATDVIDYKAADVVDKLRELRPFKHLFTASGDPVSQKVLTTLLEPTGGKFVGVLLATLSCLQISTSSTQLSLKPRKRKSTVNGGTGGIKSISLMSSPKG